MPSYVTVGGSIAKAEVSSLSQIRPHAKGGASISDSIAARVAIRTVVTSVVVVTITFKMSAVIDAITTTQERAERARIIRIKVDDDMHYDSDGKL